MLAVTPISGAAPLSVSASSAGSYDPDGSIVSTKIDFGDGTRVSAASATHTYAVSGTYHVTVTITDNVGGSSRTSATVNVQGPAVTIITPSIGASLTSPVHVAASASSSVGIAKMMVYVDGSAAYSANATSLDTTISMPPGLIHHVVVQAWDGNGGITKSQVAIYVANQPPVAALSVSPASGTAPLTVTASTAGSSDSDGTLASSTIDFGDGTVAASPAATHVYGNPGTYTVTAKVTDNLGAWSKTAATVTVTPPPQPPSISLAASPPSAAIAAGQSATYQLSINATGGLSGAVSLSCLGLPAEASCAFSPQRPSVGGSAAAATLTIRTTAAVSAALHPRRSTTVSLFAMWLPLIGLVVLGQSASKHRKRLVVFLMIMLLFALGMLVACSGRAQRSPRLVDPGTPAGTYTITVTASSGSIQSSTAVGLTVR
jgi:PKD repeat protein